MTDPTNENQEIWYASLEGPEAVAYERGSTTLSQGEKFIAYSYHFISVVNPESVTVILTPQVSQTYGLAVTEIRTDGFVVKELMAGTGNFDFDWQVTGIRKGYEEYRVYRPKGEGENANADTFKNPSGILVE